MTPIQGWDGNTYYLNGQPAMGRPAVFRTREGVDIKLPVHEAYIASRAPRQMAAFHRRGRKSGTTLEKVFKYLWANPGIVGKTLAPIRKQAKEIIWDDPDMLFHPNVLPPGIIAKVNKADLSVTLKNGSIWSLDGADDPQKKRGGNAKVVHFTEAGDHQEILWTQIYEPILLANHGVALFEGNFRGKNWYWRLFEAAMKGREGWEPFLLSARDSPIFTKEQLDDLEAHTPSAVFRSEYLCEAVDSMGTVFRNYEEIATSEATAAQPNRKYRAGVDLARLQDFTVVTMFDRHEWREVFKDRFNTLDWPSIKKRIQEDFKLYSARATGNSLEVIIEVNGVGDPIIGDLQEWVRDEKVRKEYDITLVPFYTDNTSKSMAVSNGSLLFETAQVQILNDEVTKTELGEFTYKKTSTHFIYGHPEGGHDDTVMSMLLALWGLGTKYPIPDLSPPREPTKWGFKQSEINKLQRAQQTLGRLGRMG